MKNTDDSSDLKFETAAEESEEFESEDEEVKKVLDITDVVGDFGLWQKLFFAIAMYTESAIAWEVFALTFMAPEVSYSCVEFDNLYYSDFIAPNGTNETTWNEMCATIINGTRHACVKWKYDHSVFTWTLIEKFDLVCAREYYVSLGNSMLLIGNFAGVIFIGFISDRFGRRKTLLMSAFAIQVVNLLLLFAQNIGMFLAARLFGGFFGFDVVLVVLLGEIVSADKRATLSSLIWIGFASAYAGYAGIAFLLTNWFHLQLFNTCSCVPILLMIWLAPESPRWLILNDRPKEAERVMIRAARWNRMPIVNMAKKVEILAQVFKNQSKEEIHLHRSYTIVDFLRLRKSRIRTAIILLVWLGLGFLYYGISLNAEIFGGNLFINFFVLGVIEIPAYALSALGCKYCSRRALMISTLSCAGIAALIYPAAIDITAIQIALVAFMKLCITVAFSIIFLYSPETFPTGIRNLAMGVSYSVSGIAGAISPFLKEMSDAIGIGSAMVILGAFGITLGMLTFILPETKGTALPETLEDGEQLGLHPFPTCSRCQKKEGDTAPACPMSHKPAS